MGAGGEAEGPVETPLTDKLHYGHLKLQNGLEALLISDAKADKASAALDVNVGSLSDPVEFPGLAHFLEHMLFYSSEKYPEEDAYSKFIAEHGGSTNAYTAAEDTNYHFEVNHSHLEPALDRFAQFFICPQISEDGVGREANAVDAEHGKNINSDTWRFMNLWKSCSNAAHAFSHFSTGNLETLIRGPKSKGLSAHQAVRDFAAARYSANIMKLVVYGREGLADLEALVRGKFECVRSKSLDASHFTGDAVLPGQLGSLIRVVPQKENDSIGMQWPIPPEQRLHRTQPSSYLSHFLGHEGEGSVYALLKARGWATQLYAGESGLSYSGRSFFEIGIVLTKAGQEHVAEVTQLVFAYIDILRQPGGVTEKRFEEIRALARMRFEFSDQMKPGSLTPMLARTLQHVPARESLLALHHVPQDFDPAAINAVLSELTPANLRMMWASKDFQGKTDAVDGIYGTEYAVSRFPGDWLDAWRSASPDPALHLPRENPFVPTDFSMLREDSAHDEPRVVLDSPLVRLWHRQETSFGAPKAVVYASLQWPHAYASPEDAVMTRLLVKLLSDGLSEVSYDAELAGLSYGVSNTASGLLVTFAGYNHKLMELVRCVLEALVDFRVDEQRFEVQRETVAKEYANLRYDQPYQTAIYHSNVVLEARRWHYTEYEEVLKDLTAADMQEWFKKCLKRAWVQAFVSGNISVAAAEGIGSYLEQLLTERRRARPIFPSQRADLRVHEIQPGRPAALQMPVPNAENENSAIILVYQVGPDSLPRNVRAELFVAATKQAAFHELRTRQQLGYLVFLSAWSHLTTRSIAFLVQSTVHGAAALEARCEAFLPEAKRTLRDMSDAEFERQRTELISAKLERPTRLREQAAREWREIDDGTLVFGRPQKEAAELEKVSRQSLLDFIEETLLDRQTRRKLSILVDGAARPKDGGSEARPPVAVEGGEAFDVAPNGTSTGEADGSRAGSGAMQDGPPVERITDIWAFKRRLAVLPSPR